MKIPTRTREHGLRFNITPMIDIVFLLIIFFLVASYLASSENSEAIELSRAATGAMEDESARRIVITVTHDALIYAGGDIITLDGFEQLLDKHRGETGFDDFEVRIRADRRVPYRTVEPLLTTCARAGVTRIKFNVFPLSRE